MPAGEPAQRIGARVGPFRRRHQEHQRQDSLERPLEPAHLDHETAQQPDVSHGEDGPGDLGHGPPGLLELETLHHEADHEHGNEAEERPGKHVERLRRVVTQGPTHPLARIVMDGDVRDPVGDEQGQHPADHRVGRRAGAGRIEQSDQLSSRGDQHEAGKQEPERIPRRQPFIDAEREQEPGYHHRPKKRRVRSMFEGTAGCS